MSNGQNGKRDKNIENMLDQIRAHVQHVSQIITELNRWARTRIRQRAAPLSDVVPMVTVITTTKWRTSSGARPGGGPATGDPEISNSRTLLRRETINSGTNHPAGARLLILAQQVFKPHDIEFCWEPAIADWQADQKEALEQGDTTIVLHLIHLRHFCGFLSLAVVLSTNAVKRQLYALFHRGTLS